MTMPRSVADVLKNHVVFELECLDRMYLNVMVPRLQREQEVAGFFRFHRGHRFASSALMEPMSKDFVARMEQSAQQHRVAVVPFDQAPYKGRKKDDIAQEFIARQGAKEGVMFLGKAQEKTRGCRPERRRGQDGKSTYPWIVRSTAMVNHYYWYIFDEDFGPFFLKFGSYFPYNAKVCLNGHEWLKRQLTKAGVKYEALDNGLLRCSDPKRAQALADSLSSAKIDALVRKWFKALPHPFPAADRRAGYRYEPFIWQGEFSLTQVLDRPLSGRVFFEEVIRENLDLGRPDQVALILGKRVTRRTPGWFRTRVQQRRSPSLLLWGCQQSQSRLADWPAKRQNLSPHPEGLRVMGQVSPPIPATFRLAVASCAATRRSLRNSLQLPDATAGCSSSVWETTAW
jgi:hypothetical protein